MTNLVRGNFLAFAGCLIWSQPASAGMPSVTLADLPRAVRSVSQTGLTELARQRLEVISFFLLSLLACAWVIRWTWNSLRKDFPVLPRLSYARALGMIVLWGMLFVLVLTLISGARELMTPGAWEKKDLTYRLVPAKPPPIEAAITARFEAISRLRDQLIAYARAHKGAFPQPNRTGEIPESLWRVPATTSRYIYVGGQTPDEETPGRNAILLYEPAAVGTDRLVVMTDGLVQWLPASEVERRLSERER